MIKGKLISLYAIEESELELIRSWRNNESLRIYFREVFELTANKQRIWYDTISSQRKDIFYMMKLNKTNTPIGVVGLNYINWINRNCQLSLYIGVDGLYIDENGWALEATTLIQEFAFNTLNMHKIIAEIYKFDILKKKLIIEAGYTQEGVLKDYVFANGKYEDSLVFSIIRDQ